MMTLETARPGELDVCDFLNANPGIKAALSDVIQALREQSPVYPTDVGRAAVKVSLAAGKLLSAAVDISLFDDLESRHLLHVAAVKAVAESFRFLEEIGNFTWRVE